MLTTTPDAVILVGGKGTRLRPMTLSVPKPMLPSAGVPYLAHLISRIAAAGMRHIVLGTSYRAEVFEQYFGDGSALGVEMSYVVEDVALGTGGAIRNVADRLRSETVFVFNGDILSGVDLGALLAGHRAADADVTLHLTRVEDPRAFGCVNTDSAGRVTAFMEKDPNPVTDQINAGTYVFQRSVIDSIPTGRPVSVERETFPGLLAAGRTVASHLDSSYWRDLGTPQDFVTGSADLVLGLAPTNATARAAADFLVLEGSSIAADAQLTGGTSVGRDCFVGAGAIIEASVLMDGAFVEAGAVIRRSVIGLDAQVGSRSVLNGAVIGDRAVVGADNELLAGVRIWADTAVAPASVRFSAA